MKTRTLMAASLFTLLAAQAMAQPIEGDPNGAYCREYTQQVIIGGVRRESYGTSCQQPDGAWKIVSSDVANQPQQEVRYVTKPVYVSEPVYVPQPVYYAQPVPVYAPQPYPYYSSSVTYGVGNGWYHNRGGYRGGYGNGYRGGYVSYGRGW